MMKKFRKKSITACIAVLLCSASFLSAVSAIHSLNTLDETEYWALLVAVGVYADDPQQDRPDMLLEIQDFHDLLVQSPWWSEDHIKVIKGKDATVTNIIKGFRWLDKMEDKNDFSLVYLTTHGSPLFDENGTYIDIPPKDEADGADEILVSYWGFAYPSLFLWDDEINFLLNRLESQGVCLIVDSCFAGGFNDPPNWNLTNKPLLTPTQDASSSIAWIQGFGEEVLGQNRVVLMASCEDEVSYSGGFGPYLIDGFRGYADTNDDGIISAEEAFYYSEPRSPRQHPTIYDGYPGDLPIIDISEQVLPKKTINEPINQNQDTPSTISYAEENSVFCGYVTDDDTSDPIENAQVSVSGRDDQWNFYENESTSDYTGFYSINVPAGRYRISVYADGYLSRSAGPFEIDEYTINWVNFSLQPNPPEHSIICGYITDEETAGPIALANVSLLWHGGQNQFYRNDTLSDYNGFYSMYVAAGEVDLDVMHYHYFHEFIEELDVDDYETIWVNFSLTPKPTENAVVCGYITDAETTEPLDNAHITFYWVDFASGLEYANETQTNSFGFYSIHIAPGELYVDIREMGYEYYDPYRHDALENEVVWLNTSLEKETIEVDIIKPLKALYVANQRLIPFTKTRIFGSIDIEAYIPGSWHGSGNAEYIEFYIDDILKANLTSQPYNWTWNERTFGKHTIKVIAYDDDGNSATQEIDVYKIL